MFEKKQLRKEIEGQKELIKVLRGRIRDLENTMHVRDLETPSPKRKTRWCGQCDDGWVMNEEGCGLRPCPNGC